MRWMQIMVPTAIAIALALSCADAFALPALPAISLPAFSALAIPEFPPWVWLGFFFNFANNIQKFKRNAGLVWGTIRGGKDAKCMLCDKIVTKMLDMTGAGDTTDGAGELECDEICPFKLSPCVKVCSKLKEAIATSAHYPCVAIHMCPKMDEFGEVPQCEWSWKNARCNPHFVCQRTRTLPLPRCELNPGFKKWRKYTTLMSSNVNALASAVKHLPKCGEKGANPNLCINEPTGFGLWSEYGGLFLVFVVATTLSVRAIETPGGDDDRQWLTFWMIYFSFAYFERFSAVLLSWFPLYYQVKFIVIVWLIFFKGASRFYDLMHGLFVIAKRIARLHFPNTLGKIFWQALEMTEDKYIASLEKYASYASLAQLASLAKQQGIEAVYSSLSSYADIRQRHGEAMLRALVKIWDELEVRRLEIRLIRAQGLSITDKSLITGRPSSSDPFCRFCLIPPPPEISSLRGMSFDSEEMSPTTTLNEFVRHSLRVVLPSYVFAAMMGDEDDAGQGGGEYGCVRSRTVWKSVNPVWEQNLSIELEGGRITSDGNFVNRQAPFTQLRCEVWDHDRLTGNDFVGEFSVPLARLMDGRSHRIQCTLADPKGRRGQGVRTQGEVFLELKFASS